ncbi:dihydrodipicolinate synthase family protein [Salibacteraceae bacterium]|jgi:4-hydroxy-tetrahydrodipicolinate synthase|nr:dihydrodipicolinate synthase family protein [Salibacteraceae bacterium]MDB4104633.1 dihydrodipicolinate synthase family protein [Salibacteraceae bacterium]MDB9709944.1 dihydrodipicolinate synthase family protein [Salibacteraceae bacterium]MDC1304160.1 dihydrodipicolinate synthase family protein [Salibacteraceae bacterium]
MKDLNKITGPVIPIPVPFDKNQNVDYAALEKYTHFLVDAGIKNVMTTVGTSRYNLLSTEECKNVNRVVAQAAAGKAISIVANPTTGGTKSAIDFAKHVDEIGADYLLAYYPERHYGDDYIIEFFQSIIDNSSCNILIHEMPMRNGLGPGTVQYSLELLTKLMSMDKICGVKEEALDPEYSNMLVENLADKAIIIGAGGGMSRYLKRDKQRGAKAYLGGIGNFVPSLELEFFAAMMNGDNAKAESIVEGLELPLFQATVPMGWHPALKAMLSITDHMQPFERKPMKQTTPNEVAVLKEILKKNSWV